MANRVPLILNTSSNQIQELPTGDNLDLSNSGIHNAGVITATSFTGDGSNLTGLTAVGVGAIGGLTVKNDGSVVGTAGSISSFDFIGSYITATANTGAAGVTTVTLSETPTFSAVTVTNNINANGRIVGAATSNVIPFLYSNYSDLPSAATYHGAFAHVHATQKAYYAHGGNWIELVNKDTNGNIVGDNSTNITGIAGVTASTLTGTLQTASQPNITSVGTLSSLNVTGNVSVGGTLTYEDVTNVDAVGLITARSGVNISGGELKVGTGVTVGQSGIVSATAFSGNVNSQDGTAYVLIPGAGTGDHSQLYNTFLYNSNGQAILTPTAGSEHFAGDSDGFTAGNASNLNAGTVPTVRLGSGTANSSSFLRGDQTWAAVTSTTINNNADNRVITGSGTANTLNAESNVLIDSSGRLLIGTSTEGHPNANNLTIAGSTNSGITLRSANDSFSAIYFSDATSGTAEYEGAIVYGHSGNTLRFGTNHDTWLEINSSGNVTPYQDSTNDLGENAKRWRNLYADTLYGDGSNLTGITQTTINNNADNRVITGSGTANTLNGESNLTYDGTRLSTGNSVIIGGSAGGGTVGSNSVNVGGSAGYSNPGQHSVNIGGNAAGYSNAGDYSINVGTTAGYSNAGDYTINIGYGAGYSGGGSNSVNIGRSAGDGAGGSNNIVIGYNADPTTSSTSNEITLGDTNITKFRIPGINFVLKDNGGTPSSGQVLTADGSGEGYWATASGTTINSNADNRIITGSGSANTLNGESNLTFDGTTLSATGTVSLAGTILLQPGGTAWSTTNNRPQIKRDADGELRLGAGSDSDSKFTVYTAPSSGASLVERLRIPRHGGVIFKGGPLQEKVSIVGGKLSNNTNIDLAYGNVHYFTTQESTTSTPNIRVNSAVSLDSVMAVGETVAVTIITTAAAAGYSAALQIHGNTQTVNWVGGTAPAAGGASGVDIYNYTIIKTGSSAFTVIGNLTKTSA